MNSDATGKWPRRLTGPVAAALVLAGFWAFLQASLWNKSLAYDEIVHATAGYAYWKFDDYRLNPENGNLPQRVEALPFLFGRYPFPAATSEPWRGSDEWVIADQWFNRVGNDAAGMLHRGRAAAGLMAVALGALVWAAARRRFGPAGGMLSLGLFVLNPTILANGGLMTSDTAAALFFLAAPLAWWALLRRVTAGRLLGAGLAVGGLFVSKVSAFLILPIGLFLVAARLSRREPLPVDCGLRRTLSRRGGQALAFAAASVAVALLAAAVIWACYGFRFSAYAPAVSGAPGADHAYQPWSVVLELATPTAPPVAPAARVFAFARRHHLLPEAYIYGCAYAWKFSGGRGAFLNGAYGFNGWYRFFPYTFLVKTPLPLFGVILLAAAATAARWRRRPESLGRLLAGGLDATLPLWTLFACYWTAAIFSHMDIGHRYILSTYPPLFILCGSAACWPAAVPAAGRRLRSGLAATGILVAALAAETLARFPNYLAYFNGIVRPADGYRHLVDSSSDWGEELPAIKRYLDERKPPGPLYLSYFGSGSPTAYGIHARLINCILPVLDSYALPFYVVGFPRAQLQGGVADFLAHHPEFEAVAAFSDAGGDRLRAVFVRRPDALQLHGGTYFISTTILQSVKWGSARAWDPPFGPWNARDEHVYQQLRQAVQPFLRADPGARQAIAGQVSPDEFWAMLVRLIQFDEFRFGRLKAYLRQRSPDAEINDSILVYHLTDAEVAQAIDGPPPELGPDVAAELDPASIHHN